MEKRKRYKEKRQRTRCLRQTRQTPYPLSRSGWGVMEKGKR